MSFPQFTTKTISRIDRAPKQEINDPIISTGPQTLKEADKQDPLANYYGYILAGMSGTAFSTLVYTIYKQTKGGRYALQVNDFLSTPVAGAARDPKVTAYILAGKAFGVASLLCLTGAATLIFGVSSALGAENVQDLPNKLKTFFSKEKSLTNKKEEIDEETKQIIKHIQEQIGQFEVNEKEHGTAFSRNLGLAFRKSVFGGT